MAQTTFTDNVFVDGSQDTKQLRVQGHTTQTQALQTWENSAGTVQGQVTSDGRFLLGDDVGLSSPDALMEAHRLETSTTKPKRGFHSLGRVSDTLTNIAQWIVQELEIRGSGNISALQTALRVRASNMNTGTPAAGAELRAADFEVINDAAAGAAALPIATGLQVAVTNAASKTITQAFGLHVKMNNSGTITTPYAIFTEGAGVTHLEDYFEVKRPTATPGTPATDFIRVYPKTDGNLYAKNWSGVETQLGGGTSFTAQTANTVFAGPVSGVATAPTFRALVANDIPALDAAKITTGVFNNVLINWAAPGAIGSTTPASMKASSFSIAPSSGDANMTLDTASGQNRLIIFRTASSPRWAISTNNVAEAIGNVGSDFNLYRYDNTGAYLGASLSISRANGYALFSGNVAVSTSSNPQVIVTGPSGQYRSVAFCSNGVARWIVGANTATESGSGVGSNFTIDRYNDAGTYTQSVLTINRGNGNITIGSNLGLGVATPTWSLELASNSAAKPGGGSWSTTSDRRVKRNITPYTNGLDFLRQIPSPISYEYNGKGQTPEGLRATGFIAQELQTVAPSWVQSVKGKLTDEEDETDLLYVNNSDLVYVLMNSVLELANRVETLEKVS